MTSNKLSKAKAGLILDQPFFASLLMSMEILADKSTPTFKTNGSTIWFNPKFVETLSVGEITFVLAHEVMHVVFQHMTERGERDAYLWNVAGDYIINDILGRERVGTMPEGGLLDPAIVKAGNGTTTGVYNYLYQKQQQQKQQQQKQQQQKQQQQKQQQQKQQGKAGQSQPSAGEPGGPLDQVVDAGKDSAENKAKATEIKVKIIQARNAAKMCGKLSAGLDRLVGNLTEPVIDWQSALRNFLTAKAKIDFSFAKPKRRFLADDLLLPSLTGEALGKIAIGVDCSGSICNKILDQFSAEIKAIIEDTRPESIEVIYFDSEVTHRESFGPEDYFEIKPVGGGGTAFSPVIEALENDAEPPVALVMLTDLCCNDFGNAPSFPVLWATTYETKAPYGEILKIKGE